MMKNEKDMCIFSQKLAGWLMLHGCKLLKISPSKNDETKMVYYFPNTEFVASHVQSYKLR